MSLSSLNFNIYGITPGRILLTLSQLSTCCGAFIADFNETHVLNPRWPPHARFHNGQTMSLAVMLAAGTLYHLYRPKTFPRPKSSTSSTNTSPSPSSTSGSLYGDLFTTAIIGSMYTASGLTAIWYPGSDWLDPEFIRAGEPRRPQLFVFSGVLVFVWGGWGLEVLRLKGVEEGRKGKGKVK